MTVSKLRDARNAALVTHASGSQQDFLGSRFGVPRPAFISRTAWRRALLAANGYRGLPNAAQFFLEGALSDWATKLQVVLDPSRSMQIRSPGAEFTQDLVGRMVRIDGWGLFRVVGPPDVSVAPFRYEILDLCEIATASWGVPSWESLTAPVEVDAEFHAFLIREDQAGPRSQTIGDVSGTATVYVYPEVAAALPPTFLLPEEDIDPPVEDEEETYPLPLDPQPPDDRPADMPLGGILLEDETEDGGGGGPDGPFPIFLADDYVLEALTESMRAMVALGFKVRFVQLPAVVFEGVEQHYLAFDGVANFAYADGGASGYSTAYALVVKIADLPPTTAAWPPVAHLSNSSAGAFTRNLTDVVQLKDDAVDMYRHVGLKLDNSVNYNHESASQAAGAQVLCAARNLATDTARARVVRSSDGLLFWAPADEAAAEDSAPDDVVVGGFTDAALVAQATFFCAVKLIAAVFLDKVPTDAELQAYAATSDARLVWPTAILGYWPASLANGTEIPNLAGTAPLTLAGGLTSAALVALEEP